ncbi:TPA: phage tail tape measure protein [Bacillus paranthracis]|nr:phage tail tape measure protein [Bacillus paranthracis]HDR7304500.1 phage tail tape measure protein [Bacillus paranthracis]
MASTNERFAIDVVLNDQRFQSGIRNIVRGLDDTQRGARGAGDSANKMGISFGSAIKTMAGIGAVVKGIDLVKGAIGGAVTVGMEYTKQMSKVEAISGSSSLQMAQLGANARKLGADTKWSATNVAEAYEYMALAGWDSNAMIEASLPLLNLATTGALDLGKAADIVTDTMTPFGLAASEAGRVADVFATAQATANLNVEMLGETMKYAAPIAATFGASLEDTTVIAQIFANSGIKASMAGTALRAGLSRLAEPPKPAAKALAKLNVETKNTDGTMKSLRNIIGELSPKFNELTNQQQVAAAKAIFGEEAYAGWVMVLKGGLPEFDRLHGLLDTSAGSADTMAKIMANNLSGAMDNAKSAAENLGLILFSKLERSLTGSTNGAIGLMDSLSKMLDPYGRSVEAAKLMQQEEQKLAQTEALLQNQRKNGVINQTQYNRAMDDAKARFQDNTSYGKNLADSLKGVDLQLQAGKISQFQYNDMQNSTIKTMMGQVATSKEVYTSMNKMIEGYQGGKVGAQQMAMELSNSNFWMKQSAIDGGALERKVMQLNDQFLSGKMPQDAYIQGLKGASQEFSNGNLAGEVFSNRIASLDQMLANGIITQDQYNQGKRDAIKELQENGTQSGILKQMIDELDKQLANGEITQEQYNQKKKEAQIEAYNLSMAIEEEKKSQEKLNEVMEKLAPIMEVLRQVAVEVWTEVTGFLKQCMTEIKDFIGDDMEEVKLVWSVIWFAIKLVVSSIWEGIKLIIHGALDLIKGLIQFFGGLFEGDFSKMWEGIKNIFWGAIQIILGVFNLTFIKGLLTGIVKFGVSFLKNSGQIFGNFAKNSGQIFVNFVENGWTWAVNFIKNFGRGLRDLPIRMAQIAVDAWHSFANINWLGLGKNVIIEIVNGIYSMASSLFKAAAWMASQLNPVNWFSGGGSGRSAADAGSGGAMLSSTGGIGGQLFSPMSQGGLALATDSISSFNQSGAANFARAMGQLQSIQAMVSQPQKTSSQLPYMTNPQNQKPLEITVEAPIYVDGRELARGTAHYNSQEINHYEDRQNRGTGGIKKW